jgi:hypothetical protein
MVETRRGWERKMEQEGIGFKDNKKQKKGRRN